MQFLELLVIAVFSKLYLRIPVTGNAPSHAERLHLPDAVHSLYIAMALVALDLTRDNMLGMIEIDMIRKIVDLNPLNRFSAFY